MLMVPEKKKVKLFDTIRGIIWSWGRVLKDFC